MTVADMLADINSHGFTDTPDTQKLILLNDTIRDVNSRERWPFLVKTTNLNFDGSSPTPTNVPSDMRAVKWITDLTTGQTIWPERDDTIFNRYGNQLTMVDIPFAFYFVGTALKFYPIPPAATGRYQLDYWAVQSAVDASTSESSILMPPQHHRVYTLGTLAKLYSQEDDNDLASQKFQEFEARINTMRFDLFNQQTMRQDHIFVIDEDDDLGLWSPVL